MMRIARDWRVLLALMGLLALQGCATWDYQKERRELLRGPKQIALTDTHSLSASKKNAQTEWDGEPKDASKKDVARYLDEGIAAITFNCRDYFRDVTIADRRGKLARSEFNIGASIVTAAAAILQASANFMAFLGIGVTAVNQFGDAYSDVLIEGPSTPAVRSLVLELMESYAAQLRKDAAAEITYTQARVRLAAYQDICSPGSVNDIVNTSIRQSNIAVRPSGALTNTTGGK